MQLYVRLIAGFIVFQCDGSKKTKRLNNSGQRADSHETPQEMWNSSDFKLLRDAVEVHPSIHQFSITYPGLESGACFSCHGVTGIL